MHWSRGSPGLRPTQWSLARPEAACSSPNQIVNEDARIPFRVAGRWSTSPPRKSDHLQNGPFFNARDWHSRPNHRWANELATASRRRDRKAPVAIRAEAYFLVAPWPMPELTGPPPPFSPGGLALTVVIKPPKSCSLPLIRQLLCFVLCFPRGCPSEPLFESVLAVNVPESRAGIPAGNFVVFANGGSKRGFRRGPGRRGHKYRAGRSGARN